MVDSVSNNSNALIQALSSILGQGGDAGSGAAPTRPKTRGLGGLSSGIDTKALVESQLAADRTPAAQLEARSKILTSRKDAVRTLNTKLLGARLDLASLKLSGTINPRSISSSDDKIATATASTSAAPGTSLSVEITSLAKAHQIATAGQASNSVAIGGGTLGIQVGTGEVKSVTIPAGSSTLPDIAKAINDAKTGVTAAVVNQGGATPYRLVLTSGKTGTVNPINLTRSGDAGFVSLFASPQNLTLASDATLKLGGSSPITVTSPSNTFTDLVPGINVTAKGLGVVSLNVVTDASKASDAISTFVTSLNSALSFAADATKYDPATKKSGVLLQESDIRRNVDDLTRAVMAPVGGLPSNLNSLQSIGITYNRESRQFDLNKVTLSNLLQANPDGVAAIFQNGGTSSDPGVSFASLGAGSTLNGPVTLNITRAPAQAQAATIGNVAASTMVVAGVNDRLDLTINGTSYGVVIPARGTAYSNAELVDTINRTLADLTTENPGNRTNAALGSDGTLQLRTRSYGSSITLEIKASGTLNGALGLIAGVGTGVDVAGTMNGTAANGNGQVLNASTGSASGLGVVVTATVPVSGVIVTPRKGVAQSLQDRIAKLTDAEKGVLTNRDNAIKKIVADNTAQVAKIDARLEQRRKFYEAKYLAMEQNSAKYQSIASYLSSNNTANSNNR